MKKLINVLGVGIIVGGVAGAIGYAVGKMKKADEYKLPDGWKPNPFDTFVPKDGDLFRSGETPDDFFGGKGFDGFNDPNYTPLDANDPFSCSISTAEDYINEDLIDDEDLSTDEDEDEEYFEDDTCYDEEDDEEYEEDFGDFSIDEDDVVEPEKDSIDTFKMINNVTRDEAVDFILQNTEGKSKLALNKLSDAELTQVYVDTKHKK